MVVVREKVRNSRAHLRLTCEMALHGLGVGVDSRGVGGLFGNQLVAGVHLDGQLLEIEFGLRRESER